MKKTWLGDLIKSAVIGVGIACTIFCLIGICIDQSFK
jgi:hypothetical protein